MNIIRRIEIDNDGEDSLIVEPITLESKQPAVMISIGRWFNEVGGDDGKSITFTLPELGQFIVELTKFYIEATH